MSLPALWLWLCSRENPIWKWGAVDFKSLLIHLCRSVGGNAGGFKRDGSSEHYSGLFHTALAPTVQTYVPVAVIMWYCRHLSSLLVEGQALWCSLASAPVSADYRLVIERSCSYEGLWCQPTCVYHDSGDTQSVLLLSGAPNEVITVLQTGVTLTFDPCPSPCCNVNNSSRHLPGGVPVTLSLIGGWHAELSRKWPVCVKIKVGWCLLMRQT